MTSRKQQREEAMSGPTLNIPARWLQMMKPTETILLAYLDRHSNRPTAQLAKDGWFQCDARLIKSMIGLPIDTQTRTIVQLVERGFLETDRRGQGARRHLRINYEALAAAKEKMK